MREAYGSGAGKLAIGRGRCCAEVGRGGFVEGFRGVDECSGQGRQVVDADDPLFRPESSTAAAWRAGYRAGSLRPDRCFILPMRVRAEDGAARRLPAQRCNRRDAAALAITDIIRLPVGQRRTPARISRQAGDGVIDQFAGTTTPILVSNI